MNHVDAPDWVQAFLAYIDTEICRVMWNREQEKYASPFQNTGAEFENDVLAVRAYSWSWDHEDSPSPQPWNFEWKGRALYIYWYKYYTRSLKMSRDLSPVEGIEMLNECLASIRAMDADID